MEVESRSKLLTLLTLFSLFTLFKLLPPLTLFSLFILFTLLIHCLDSGMGADVVIWLDHHKNKAI